MKQEIELYLERLKAQYGYNEQELEMVREFRESPDVEHVTFEMYKALIAQRLVCVTRKIKKPRNLYLKDDRFYYLEHYYKQFNYCGYLHSEQFLEERDLKEAEERRIIEENRRLKQLKKEEQKLKEQRKKHYKATEFTPIEEPTKKKRPRINR